MDPNVQVALVSVLATLITTTGVVVVALINNRRERSGAASAGVDAAVALDETDVLDRMLKLINENDRKEGIINRLRAENASLKRQLEIYESREELADGDA